MCIYLFKSSYTEMNGLFRHLLLHPLCLLNFCHIIREQKVCQETLMTNHTQKAMGSGQIQNKKSKSN